MTKLGKQPVVVEPEPFNLDNELMRVFKELENTDPRQDPYRSLKVLLLYQAQIMEGLFTALIHQQTVDAINNNKESEA
jgi:hypothetical protein